MKKKRILSLANLIEQQPHAGLDADKGFSMRGYVHNCGTPRCIAGWAAWLSYRKPRELILDDYAIFNRAKVYLGVDEVTAGRLFLPHDYCFVEKYPPSQAAATLRHLAKTGDVDWQIGGEA